MENSYFSEGHGISQIKINKPKKTVSLSTFIVSLVMVAALVTIVFLKWDDIMGFFGIEQEMDETENYRGLSVGDEVEFSGFINADGDMENYTHSYTSDKYGVIGLKSKTLNLNNYTNEVYVEGVVEKIYREIPIVLITTIYNIEDYNIENTGEDLQTGEISETQEKYLANLGLYFGEDFLTKYSLVNEGDGSALKIKNMETNIIHSIYYFKCNTVSQSSENCEYLENFYSSAARTKLVDKYGVSYYKDPEVNSRYFSNDSIFGYRINDDDDSFVKDLSTLMIIVNKNFAEKNILPKVGSLCKIDHSSIETVEKSELSYKNSNFYYFIEGLDVNKKKINCELKIDPTLSLSAQVIDVQFVNNTEDKAGDSESTGNILTGVDTQENNGTSTETEKQEAYIRDSSVEQFPINLDKKLTFTSSRGHSFVFPSSNLAYQGLTASEDFGQVGVNCFSAMNVVKYADKDLVETQGNVIIYECTVKNGFDDSDNTLIYKNIGDKHFVIKIVDPARVDFANNIEILA